MASLGTFTILAAFVVSAYAAAAAVAGARRASRRLVDSAVGAFYLVAALLTVGTAVIMHAFVTDDYTIKYVQRYSDSVQPFIYKLTSYWGGLDGSIMFWVFLLAIFGSIAVHVNRERHRELMPYVVAIISVVQMFFLFLMVVPQRPVRHLPVLGTGRGARPEPAAPERLHGDPPAGPVRRVRGHDHPVRVRPGGADHRAPRRFLAARRAPLDDGELAVPVVRPHARHDLGLRGAGVGRLLGLGSGRERRASCRG